MTTATVDLEFEDEDLVKVALAANELGMTLNGYMNYVVLKECLRLKDEEITRLKEQFDD